MTQKEEDLLRELTLLIDRLKALSDNQAKTIKKMGTEIESLKRDKTELLQKNRILEEKYSSLLTSGVLVAKDEDWLKTRKRLENLQVEILRAIKLLEVEWTEN